MKNGKRILALVLVLVVLLPVMLLPVSAASSAWVTRFQKFQQVKEGDKKLYPGYTSAIQRFLICYSDAFEDSINLAGGVDGYYGDATIDAVKVYQGAKGLTADAWVGTGTWGQIAKDLTLTTHHDTYGYFYMNNRKVIYVYYGDGNPYEYTYYKNDTTQGSVFHNT